MRQEGTNLERCFLKFPEGVAHLETSPALDPDRARLNPYFAKTDERVLIANLSPEEQESAKKNGAKVYADVLFTAASNRVMLFDHFPRRMRFWDDVSSAIPTDAPPSPWFNASLTDVLAKISAPAAWNITKGAGVTVVIVDSGINGDAPDFGKERRSEISLAPSFSDGAWRDALGHGSMVASIAAASASNGGEYNGVAPEANILSARTTYQSSDLFTIYENILDAITTSKVSGPVVVNNSYQLSRCKPQSQMPSDHPYADLIRKMVASGIPMVFAAGNNHADMMCGNDPASCAPNTIWAVNSLDEVITVGAVNWEDTNQSGAHGNSSRGPGEWSVVSGKPDVVAPCYGRVRWGGEYRCMEWWGTSGAAPLVTGLAALLLAYGSKKGKALSPKEVAGLIRRGCRPIPNAAPSCVGAGRIDCYASLRLLNGE